MSQVNNVSLNEWMQDVSDPDMLRLRTKKHNHKVASTSQSEVISFLHAFSLERVAGRVFNLIDF